MYCSTNGSRVDVYEDSGRQIRKISVRGTVESACMSGSDKVAITYVSNDSGKFRYTELWSTNGNMIRRTSCR